MPLPALAAAAALAAATPAAPTDAARDQDLRCLLVMVAVNGKATDPAMKGAMQMGAVYFLGKVKGREPNVDLQPALEALLPRMDEATLRAEAARCGQEMSALSAETSALSTAFRGIAGRAGP